MNTFAIFMRWMRATYKLRSYSTISLDQPVRWWYTYMRFEFISGEVAIGFALHRGNRNRWPLWKYVKQLNMHTKTASNAIIIDLFFLFGCASLHNSIFIFFIRMFLWSGFYWSLPSQFLQRSINACFCLCWCGHLNFTWIP